jgi:hypothetical protein
LTARCLCDTIQTMFWIRVFAVVALTSLTAFAQRETYYDSVYSSESAQRSPLRWVINTPTAGMLPRGSFDLDMRTFSGGGLQSALGIGLMDRFSVALAYGASRVLSDTMPDYNPRLEVELKLKLMEENDGLPAIAAGYSSKGYGPYDADNKRYQIKSPGFYAAFSKNFKISTNPASLHWGANYSLENKVDNDPNVWFGFNADLSENMIFLAEYDFGLNDNKRYSVYGLGRGYFNIGVVWYLT